MTLSSKPHRLPDHPPPRPISIVDRRRAGSAPGDSSAPKRSGVPKLTWYLGLAALLTLANAVGYRIYRSHLRPASSAAAEPAPAPAPPQAATSEAAQALLRAHRLAALAAMEQGDYGAAERELLESQKLEPGRSETRDLLRIVRGVPAGSKKAAASPPPRPAPEPARAKLPPRVVARANPARAPEPAAHGTLLVVSTPPGILVLVDGQPADVTPARIAAAPGSHSVALVRGDARLFERQVRVVSGAVASVDADVSAQLAPRPAPAPADEPAEELLPLPEPEDRPAAPPSPAPAPAPAPRAAPEPAAPAAGEIYVTSPEVYGEVFINGRRYGFPPLLAKGVPAGRATVEIRINGVPRRSTVVQVEPNKRLSARLR